jgi:UDP-N-acetylmuramate dehydrogenase
VQRKKYSAPDLGRGSNVLFPDQGLRGMVIVNTRLSNIAWQNDCVRVEAGYSLRRLAREAAEKGLSGLEFACGIPGTVGAALAINAGAYGQQIGDVVETVRVLTPEGKDLLLNARDIQFTYSEHFASGKQLCFFGRDFEIENRSESRHNSGNDEWLAGQRRMTQPLEYPNAGSVFRNPPGDSAGRLIEQAGWKGHVIGHAQVSEKHANFIVNLGKARSEDVLKLIEGIQEDVRRKFGVELKTEICIIKG